MKISSSLPASLRSYYHRRRLHRGNGIFAPVLSKEPGQEYGFAPVTFGRSIKFFMLTFHPPMLLLGD